MKINRPGDFAQPRNEVIIDSFVSRDIVTLSFHNPEKVNIEALYCFPAESDGALTAVNVRSPNGLHISGLENKDNAFDYYNNALEDGDSSMLLEREQKDVFVLNLGNVPPGESVDVEIEYINHISISENTGQIRIPLSLPPRYVSLDTDWAEQNVQSPPFEFEVPYKAKIDVVIRNMPCDNLRSPSHEITIEQRSTENEICLGVDFTSPDRDFILNFDVPQAAFPLCLASRHPNGKSYVICKTIPDFNEWMFHQDAPKSDVLFFLDCSSSMAGVYIESAREALELCLRSLNHGDCFNLIAFGSDYRSFSDRPVAYSQETLDDVLDFLSLLEADMGGTEMLDALKYGCSIPLAENCSRQCVLITDGATFNTDEIINYICRNHCDQRFYTFGIGPEASYSLIKGLAQSTGGIWEMVDSDDDIPATVIRQFSRMLQTNIKDIELKKANGESLTLSRDVRAVYADDCLTLFAQSGELSESEILTLQIKAGTEIFSCPCKVRHCGEDDALGVLWAQEKIQELEKQHDHPSSAEKIDYLCRDFSILNHHNSFIAVYMRPHYEKLSGMPHLREVPLMLNANYEFRYGNDSDIIPLLHEKQAVYDTGSKDRKWYLEILKSQGADGLFRGKQIIAAMLNLDANQFDKYLDELQKQAIADYLFEEKALTFLAKHLLESDPETKNACRRALRKAETFFKNDHLDTEIREQLLNLIPTQ